MCGKLGDCRRQRQSACSQRVFFFSYSIPAIQNELLDYVLLKFLAQNKWWRGTEESRKASLQQVERKFWVQNNLFYEVLFYEVWKGNEKHIIVCREWNVFAFSGCCWVVFNF